MGNRENDIVKSNLRQDLLKHEQIIVEALLKGSDVELRNDRGKIKVVENRKKIIVK